MSVVENQKIIKNRINVKSLFTMKLKILAIIILMQVGNINSQNLVKDGSFEDYIPCPTKKEKQQFPLTYWNRINYSNTTDYFNTIYNGCFNDRLYYPGQYKNGPYTEAQTGSGFIGGYPICLNLKSNCRYGAIEPASGELRDTLQKDSIYTVSLAINLPVTSTHNVKSFSVVFMPDSFVNPKPWDSYNFIRLWQELREKPIGIAEFDITSSIYNRSEWKTYTTEYKATGNEKYILVGFYPRFTEAQVKYYDKIIEKGKKNKDYRKFFKELSKCYTLYKIPEDAPEGDFQDAYFYIDDVSVELKKQKK